MNGLDLKDETQRAVIYRLLLALIPLLAILGAITDEQAATLTSILGGLAGSLLAALNTSTRRD